VEVLRGWKKTGATGPDAPGAVQSKIAGPRKRKPSADSIEKMSAHLSDKPAKKKNKETTSKRVDALKRCISMAFKL